MNAQLPRLVHFCATRSTSVATRPLWEWKSFIRVDDFWQNNKELSAWQQEKCSFAHHHLRIGTHDIRWRPGKLVVGLDAYAGYEAPALDAADTLPRVRVIVRVLDDAIQHPLAPIVLSAMYDEVLALNPAKLIGSNRELFDRLAEYLFTELQKYTTT